MIECQRCTDGRFICENHPDRPFLEIVTVTAVVLGSPAPPVANHVNAPEIPEDYAEERGIPRGQIFWADSKTVAMKQVASSHAQRAAAEPIVATLAASLTTPGRCQILTGCNGTGARNYTRGNAALRAFADCW